MNNSKQNSKIKKNNKITCPTCGYQMKEFKQIKCPRCNSYLFEKCTECTKCSLFK